MHNVRVAYILAFINRSWFWIAIWVLYYLRFADYSGIGIIESVMITSTILFEIPTGAFADIIGKKKVLIFGFLIMGIGNLIMGFAGSLSHILISVIIMTLGGALYSGSFEALIYDSLLDEKKEDTFPKVISNVNSLYLLSLAVAGVGSGFLYTISPQYPFIVTGAFYMLGSCISLLLKEPHHDRETFSFRVFREQTVLGFRQLFKTKYIARVTTLLVILFIPVVMSYEVLDDTLLVAYGFSPQQLGIVVTVMFLIASFASQATSKLLSYMSENSLLYLLLAFTALTYLGAPFFGPIFGAFLIYVRVSAVSNIQNIEAIIMNGLAESKNRATTLSTFNMIKNIPYILGAFFVGRIIDIVSPLNFSSYLGSIFLIIILMTFIFKQNLAYEK